LADGARDELHSASRLRLVVLDQKPHEDICSRVLTQSALGRVHGRVYSAEGAIVWAMAPRTRPDPELVRPSAQDEADIRAGLAELDRGEGVELTADELRHWAETGEWPERLD